MGEFKKTYVEKDFKIQLHIIYTLQEFPGCCGMSILHSLSMSCGGRHITDEGANTLFNNSEQSVSWLNKHRDAFLGVYWSNAPKEVITRFLDDFWTELLTPGGQLVKSANYGYAKWRGVVVITDRWKNEKMDRSAYYTYPAMLLAEHLKATPAGDWVRNPNTHNPVAMWHVYLTEHGKTPDTIGRSI